MADWHRLGEHIVARRIALKYPRREDLANAAQGLSLRTLGDLEAGRRTSYHANTLATLEHALHWAPGSITAILDGGRATEQPGPGAPHAAPNGAPNGAADRYPRDSTGSDEALTRVMRDPRIDDATKMKVVKLLIAERQRFERELGERVEDLIRAFQPET